MSAPTRGSPGTQGQATLRPMPTSAEEGARALGSCQPGGQATPWLCAWGGYSVSWGFHFPMCRTDKGQCQPHEAVRKRMAHVGSQHLPSRWLGAGGKGPSSPSKTGSLASPGGPCRPIQTMAERGRAQGPLYLLSCRPWCLGFQWLRLPQTSLLPQVMSVPPEHKPHESRSWGPPVLATSPAPGT